MAEPTIIISPQGPPVNIVVGPGTASGGMDPDLPADLAAHIIDPTPHPAYDDQPDLTVIFENHLI